MHTEQRQPGLYVATLVGGTIRVFGPGIGGVAEYQANGEPNELADAIDYTFRKIVCRPFYIMKNRGAIQSSDGQFTWNEYITFDRYGVECDRMTCNSDVATDYARQNNLIPVSPSQWHALVTEWARGTLMTITNKEW